MSTALLFETIVAHHLRIEKVILASSQAVYGEGKYRYAAHGTLYPGPRPLAQLAAGTWEVLCPQCREPLAPLPIDKATVNPHTAYGISKHALEMGGFALGRRYDIPNGRTPLLHRPGPAQLLQQCLLRCLPHLHDPAPARPPARHLRGRPPAAGLHAHRGHDPSRTSWSWADRTQTSRSSLGRPWGVLHHYDLLKSGVL